ncbi:hypothetical protein A33M_0369 [Rhodovulum sp. PH10]|uniref:hypothetical protein n=1 Tax=Rhodovulum sp. PH10 TaxID=1187851 RepID=UPI00027C230E|nr:hypothetical protein [Rhodovulum sp. PH10]EJW13210.1 hypothetical protein A33M_0369 [Rhodovulum sp. PH10]
MIENRKPSTLIGIAVFLGSIASLFFFARLTHLVVAVVRNPHEHAVDPTLVAGVVIAALVAAGIVMLMSRLHLRDRHRRPGGHAYSGRAL